MTFKFRVYDTVNDMYIKDLSNLWINPEFSHFMEFRGDLDGDTVFELNDSLLFEQWTGLIDKNGKEIYEGDILSTKHTGQSCYDRDDSKLRVVRQSAKDFQLHLFHIGENDFPASGFGLSVTTNRRWIIIGNIHENKDLLSGKV